MVNQVSFENTEVSYTISGKGPVVVWLHGFMEDKSIWQGQLIIFDAITTNICIDLLGHGKTGNIVSEDIYSMELQAKVVLTVLNKLQIDTFSIVGHSMGGYVGLCLLKSSPKKITHFVLLNSTSRPDTDERKKNRLRAIKIVEQQKEVYVRLGVVNLFSQDSRTLLIEEIKKLVDIAQKTTVQGIIGALMGMMHRESKEEVLKNYTGKKIVITGKNDPVLSSEKSYKEAMLAKTQFVQLAGGHMTYLESKNQLNTSLADFFCELI